MERRKAYFFAVDEDRDEDDEEADESFLEMEELFHLKFGKKSKKKAAGKTDDIPERPTSMAQQNFNMDKEESLGTLEKVQAKERLKEHLKARRPSNTYNLTTGESTVEGNDSRSGNSDHTPSARGKTASSQNSSSTSSSESQSEENSRSNTKGGGKSGNPSEDEDSN